MKMGMPLRGFRCIVDHTSRTSSDLKGMAWNRKVRWPLPINRVAFAAFGALSTVPSLAAGQSDEAFAVHGGAVLLGTVAAPGFGGRRLAEGYVTQPMLMAHGTAWSRRLAFSAALNLEPFTLRRGELNAGIWGEGYIDRRHPHTLMHEAMLMLEPAGAGGRLRSAISLGKGFVPFGTDDPMSRPLVKFPINHHLSQILERGQVIVTAGGRGGVIEAALFNGDEPATPNSGVNISRFADSWAARVTAWVGPSVELSASYADVASPEVPDGTGLDQRKWNGAARFERTLTGGRKVYALAEYSRSRDYDGGHAGLPASSLLAEGSYELPRTIMVALRVERTDRLEEERLADPFRSPRPHYDAHQLGVTRFVSAAANVTSMRSSRVRPFLEVSRLYASPRPGPSFFEPGEFYGSRRVWSFSAGARIGFGQARRMGRYGPAARTYSAGRHMTGHEHD